MIPSIEEQLVVATPARISPMTGGTRSCLSSNGANKMMPSTTEKIHVGSVMRAVAGAA